MSEVRPAIFLSVRNKATRLPGKVLLDLEGASVTERLIERLKLSCEAGLIVVTTSTHPNDRILVKLARGAEVEVFRGSEDDKLDRYLSAALQFGVDVVAVVDGDDPLCDPGYIDRLLRAMREDNADFATVAGLPVGVTANVVRVVALQRVCEVKTERDTEVWAGYFTETGLFRTRTLLAEARHYAPHLRMTLDYPEDYEFFRTVYRRLHRPGHVFTLDEVLTLLRAEPAIAEINRGAVARYEEHLRRATRVGFVKS